MNLHIPKALIVYIVLLLLSCTLVYYKTNEVNTAKEEKEQTVFSQTEEKSEIPVNPEKTDTEDIPVDINEDAPIMFADAIDILYNAYVSVAEKNGFDADIAEKKNFEEFAVAGEIMDRGGIIRRNEFAALSVKAIDFLRIHGLAGIEADAHINEIYYIPDVGDVMYSESILELYRMGIVSGNDSQGNYEPFQPVLYGNAVTMTERLFDTSLRVKTDIPGNNRKSVLPVNAILQNPELPSGCEITSLTTVLKYIGFDADKCDLADNYLDKGPVGETNYHDAFIGNPRTWGPHGCFAPVIARAAQKYLDEHQSNLVAYNTTGMPLEELFKQIDEGYPVVIWGTMWMKQSYESVVWNIDGERVPWIANEHCMVLHGYDREKGVVLIADPLAGNVKYDMDLFETRFKELFMQSVIIK